MNAKILRPFYFFIHNSALDELISTYDMNSDMSDKSDSHLHDGADGFLLLDNPTELDLLSSLYSELLNIMLVIFY